MKVEVAAENEEGRGAGDGSFLEGLAGDEQTLFGYVSSLFC